MNEIREFINCSCETEGLYIVKYKEEEEVYLSIFTRGINPKRFGFKDKLRYIWKALTTNAPFDDELVFGKKQIKKLISILKDSI
jgi:hypothetical protein